MLSYFLTPVLMTILLFLINKFVDLKSFQNISAFNEVRFKSNKKIYDICFLLTSFSITYFIVQFIVHYSDKHYSTLKKYEFVLYPNSKWVWALPSLFFSFLITCLLYTLIAKIHFKDDYKEFVNYSNQYNGYNLQKLGPIVIFLISIFVSFSFYVGLNTYFYIDEDKLIFREFLSFKEESIPMTDVKAIKYCEYNYKGKKNKITYQFSKREDLLLNDFMSMKTEEGSKMFVNEISKRLHVNVVYENCRNN